MLQKPALICRSALCQLMAQSGHVEASVRLSAFAAKQTWRRRKQEDAAHQHYEECGLKHAVLYVVAAYRSDDMLERWRSFFLDTFKY